MDGLLWDVYRDVVVIVALWLVLVGLALFALSVAAARVRPTIIPLARLPDVVTLDVVVRPSWGSMASVPRP
jgi:hypothetical protein